MATLSAMTILATVGASSPDLLIGTLLPAGPGAASGSPAHQRAGAVIGEQLEQDRVRHPSVQDDDALDPLLERIETGLDLGDHAARNGDVGAQPARVIGRKLADQGLRLVE